MAQVYSLEEFFRPSNQIGGALKGGRTRTFTIASREMVQPYKIWYLFGA